MKRSKMNEVHLMTWAFLVVLLILPGQGTLDTCRRNEAKAPCRISDSDRKSSTSYQVDKNNSTLTVFFPLCANCPVKEGLRCTEKRTVVLYVYRVIKKEEEKLQHSEKIYVCAECSSSADCYSEMAEMKFYHVFNGDYTFTIQGRMSGTYTHPRFKADTMLDFKTATSLGSRELVAKPDSRAIRIALHNLNWTGIWICKWTLQLSECGDSACSTWKLKYLQTRKAECEGEILQYTFEDLKPGNYSLKYKPVDERCELQKSVWMPTCSLSSQVQLFPPSPVKPVPQKVISSSDNVIWSVSLAGVILFLVAFIWIVLYMRKCCSYIGLPQQPMVPETNGRDPSTHVSVVLIYCMDSPAFAAAISKLKKYLEGTCHFTVLDYADPSVSEEVVEDPPEWIRCAVMDRRNKIIVVDTECAARRTSFREPHRFDSLFQWAFRIIREQLHNPYRRVFVVSFEGYSDGEKLAKDLGLLSFYMLPKKMPDLLCGIRGDRREPFCRNSAYKEFEQAVTELKTISEETPDHLESLLVV